MLYDVYLANILLFVRKTSDRIREMKHEITIIDYLTFRKVLIISLLPKSYIIRAKKSIKKDTT